MAASNFRVLDAVYNSSFQFLGNINTNNTENGNIQFMAATKFHIHNGETLFYTADIPQITQQLLLEMLNKY